MTFWTAQSDMTIDGSEDNAHVQVFGIIPNGTTAKASIKKAELTTSQYDNTQIYQITYMITDGDFKDFVVKQKIHCFDSDTRKRDRSVNMLMRLFNLCNYKPNHSNSPTNDDMAKLQNKIVGIKIREWQKDGKEGNWVSEIHANDANFRTVTGTKMETKTPDIASSYYNSGVCVPNSFASDNGDIPF